MISKRFICFKIKFYNFTMTFDFVVSYIKRVKKFVLLHAVSKIWSSPYSVIYPIFNEFFKFILIVFNSQRLLRQLNFKVAYDERSIK